MIDFLYIGLFVVVIAFLSAFFKKGKGRNFKYNPNETWPFEKKKLMTTPEHVLYFRLIETLPELCIFSQVQISQLISVKKGHNFQQWFNRINRMSADFVVTDKAMNVIAVIELDDKTHNKPDRIEADKKKDKALTSAGIKAIRWKVAPMPTLDLIRKEFKEEREKATTGAGAKGKFADYKELKKSSRPTAEDLIQLNIAAGRPARSSLKWSLIETQELIALHAEKKTIKEIAAQFERSEISIISQLEKINPPKNDGFTNTKIGEA